MKKKQIMASVCAMAMIAVIGCTAFGAVTTSDSSAKAARKGTITERGERPELTDEQKAEMEAKRTEMQAKAVAADAKWTALTAAQKEEIYALKDKAIDAEIETIDKYVSLGLMDSTAAAEMKTKLTESKAEMRASGKMPGHGGMMGGKAGDKGFRGEVPAGASEKS